MDRSVFKSGIHSSATHLRASGKPDKRFYSGGGAEWTRWDQRVGSTTDSSCGSNPFGEIEDGSEGVSFVHFYHIGKVDVAIEISGDLSVRENDPVQIVVLITEDNLSSEVKRGENSGRSLQHDGVVRFVKQAEVIQNQPDLPYRIEFSLDWNPEWKKKDCRAVVLLQGRILSPYPWSRDRFGPEWVLIRLHS